MKTTPGVPRLAHRFFKWYCRSERYEELHGDLEEFFYERVEKKGLFNAQLFYTLNVIRCCQPYAWKRPSAKMTWSFTMYKSYYTTTFRVMLKNPLSTFINISGLSMAIGMSMFVYGMTHWINSRDDFHENKNTVFLVTFFADLDGSMKQNGMSPAPLGEMMKQDFPSIKRMTRVADNNVVIKQGPNVFHERVRFVDSDFLKVFTFPLKWGTTNTLNDINSIVLSEEMAVKYFGNDNPVGQDVQMIFGDGRSKQFKISGVAEKFPETTDIRFQFLVNFENQKIANTAFDPNDWGTLINATLIQVADPSDVNSIVPKMSKYKEFQNNAEHEWVISSFAFEPLSTLYERSPNITADIASNGYKSYVTGVTFVSVLALFTLALACLNYINISIAYGARRLKEIGVRKTIGASRNNMITQFLVENFILTFFALVLGLLFGAYVVIPWMEVSNGFQMDFSFAHPDLWIFLVGMLVFTALISGFYPAVFLSRLRVSKILSKSISLGRQRPASKVMLGFQLILACMLVTNGIMFSLNTSYMKNRDWGYDPSQVLYANIGDRAGFERMEATLSRDPNVLSITGSQNHLGKDHEVSVIRFPERRFEVVQMSVSPSYPEMMGLELIEGRFFHDTDGDRQSVIVNEMLVHDLGLQNALGQEFELDSSKYQIVGVVRDFHSYDFFRKLRPTILTVAAKDDYQYISLRSAKGSEYTVLEAMQSEWASLFPEIPFQGGLQQDVWPGYNEEMDFHGTFWRTVSFIAILLASMGLYGLVTLNVAGRLREFSIRKVLGARITNIAAGILKQYRLLYLVAMLIAAPLTYITMGGMFDAVYEYHIPMNYWSVVAAITLLTLVLLFVALTQVLKVVKSNPVEGLKAGE